MDKPLSAATNQRTPVIALLSGATVWGLVWYPYRVLEAQGMSGLEASILTYLVALIAGVALWRRHLHLMRYSPMLLAVGLAAGACNLGYIVATLLGEVTRVLLLFYLSPLWTVVFARFFLGERLNLAGYGVVVVSLSGACIMLWHPDMGMPWPKSIAEWLGLGAGISFALSNVLIKKASDIPIEVKSIAVFLGVIALSLLLWPFFPRTSWTLLPVSWLMLVIVGVTLVFTNAIVQFGLSNLRASQAIVIMLFELFVAALASWLLAGETLGLNEWLGGALIISASLLSIKLATD